MGNQCICLANDGKKPQSTLVHDFYRKGSTAKSSLILKETQKYQTPLPQEIAKTPESRPMQAESFYTAYTPSKSSKKRSNSFPGSETEYMSFEVHKMSVLKSDIQNLSQRISALSQASKMPSVKSSDAAKRDKALKRSLSQDSVSFNQQDILKELQEQPKNRHEPAKDVNEPVKTLESYRSDSDPATSDTVGFSHMNFRDIMASADNKVGFPLNQIVEDIIKTDEREELTLKTSDKFAERSSIGAQEVWMNTGRHSEGKKNSMRAKSYIEHDFLAVRKSMTSDIKTERKSSFEILERESLGRLRLAKKASYSSKKLIRKSQNSGFRLSLTDQTKAETQVTDFYFNSGEYPNSVVIETLSPKLVTKKYSFLEEDKENENKEGRLSARRSQLEPQEENSYPGLRKEDLEFVRKGQDTLTLVLQILNSDDYSRLEKLYEDKKEEHKLKVHYNSTQKANGQTSLKIFWVWQAPCNSEQFIRFSSNNEEFLKVDEQIDKLKEIEMIYASDSESFVLNYESYKKSVICMPRDIIYLKHVRKLADGEWADALVSVKHEDYPEFKDHLRCEIISGGRVTKDITPDSCMVKSYSEIDFRTNIPAFTAKSFIKTSIKGLVEKSYASLKNKNF